MNRRVSKAVAVYVSETLTGYDRTDYQFDEAWQVLEERFTANQCSADTVATAPHAQYVWDLRYIDAPVLRLRDTAGPSCSQPDGDLDDSGDEVVYYTNDPNMNVTALVNTSGEVVERYAYEAYGAPTILNGVKDAAGTNTSTSEWDERTVATFQNEILNSGYRYNYETGNSQVRWREYSSTLGRWLQQDPLGYIDGMNSYEYAQGGPTGKLDPGGTTIKLRWNNPPCSESEAEGVVRDQLLTWNMVKSTIERGANTLTLKAPSSYINGVIAGKYLSIMIDLPDPIEFSGETIQDALKELNTFVSIFVTAEFDSVLKAMRHEPGASATKSAFLDLPVVTFSLPNSLDSNPDPSTAPRPLPPPMLPRYNNTPETKRPPSYRNGPEWWAVTAAEAKESGARYARLGFVREWDLLLTVGNSFDTNVGMGVLQLATLLAPGSGARAAKVGEVVAGGSEVAAGVSKTGQYLPMAARRLSYASGEAQVVRYASGKVQGPATWANAKTLPDHFGRHGADFGAKSAGEYTQMSSDFLRQSQARGLPTKIAPDGTIRIYDPATNTFGSYASGGATKTFYKPDPAVHKFPTNLDYWNHQPGAAPWTP